MTHNYHGLAVSVERINEECFLRIKVVGKLTHEDYETMTPMLESAIEGIKQPEIKVLVDATKLEGWELLALG